MAQVLASRSTCPDGARHACILVREGHVLAMGYGSPAAGVPPCQECWLRKEKERTGKKDWNVCPSVHAEPNAIAMAAKFGVSVEGAQAYLTTEPCDQCLRLLMNAGVVEYLFKDGTGKPHARMVRGDDRLRSPMERRGG